MVRLASRLSGSLHMLTPRQRAVHVLARCQPGHSRSDVATATYATQVNKPFPVLSDSVDSSSATYGSAKERAQKFGENLSTYTNVCKAGGGEKGVARHVKLNKKVLVRDRINQIIDPDTELWELATTAGLGLEYGDVSCGGTVTGVGTIHGTPVMILANDGTVKGGTFYPITIQKQLRLQDIARSLRLPCLQIVDTGGAFLPLQSEIFLPGGRGFANQAIMSSIGVQQVALVSGLCTAGGAYAPTMSDVAIITNKIGNIYLGGPPLVKAATGEVVTGEELGGATLHCSVSGITDHFAKDEAESFEITRDVVASLNIPPSSEPCLTADPPLYNTADLEAISGLEKLDKQAVLAVVARLLDGSRFLEFKQMFGGNLICGFGRLAGQMVGIVANCGPITGGDGEKGGHFVQLCDNRDIPLIFLQNSSMSVGHNASHSELKERAKFTSCHSIVRVPKITLNIGGCVGDENYTMCGPGFGPNFYFMWPGTRMLKSDPATIPTDSSQGKPEEKGGKKKKQLSEYNFVPGSAEWCAARVLCDGIVRPADTRTTLARAIQLSMLNHQPMRDTRGQDKAVLRM